MNDTTKADNPDAPPKPADPLEGQLDQLAAKVREDTVEGRGSAAPEAPPPPEVPTVAEGEGGGDEAGSIGQLDSLIAQEADSEITAQRRADDTADPSGPGGPGGREAPAAAEDDPPACVDPGPDAAEARDGATAADVAEELDAQPEGERRAEAGDAQDADADADADADTSATSSQRALGLVAGIGRVEPIARHGCGLINAPLRRTSPQVRAMVGYAALLTLLNAALVLIFHLLLGM